MTPADLAYAAGFFDGEGHISLVRMKRRRETALYVAATNTHEEICWWFRSLFGGIVYVKRRRDPQHQTAWVWRVSAGHAERFLVAVLPYLKLKRPQAEIALQFRASVRRVTTRLSPQVVGKREALVTQLHALNRRGN